MTNPPSGIMELPDGSSVRASAILAIVIRAARARGATGVIVILAAEVTIEAECEDASSAALLVAELTEQWRAALGERTEPEQPVGNADDLWKSVPEGTDIDDMFGPDTEPERPAVAEFKEGDRVRLSGATSAAPLGTVMGVNVSARTAWVKWGHATAHGLADRVRSFGDLEQS